MLELNRLGGSFSHAHSSTLWKHPKWLRYNENSEKSIAIDSFKPATYAWIHESKSIIPSVYEYAKDYYRNLQHKLIFTHDEDLLSLDSRFRFAPACGYWIEDPKIYDKSKLISFITSNKTMCDGHRFRLKWAQKLCNKVDMYGKGIKEIKKKEEGLCDYYFSIAIENGKYDTYFTEKILDCFATGTIPIYYGTNKIVDYFDKDGIIFLTDDFDVSLLSDELYLSKINAVHNNLIKVMDYYTVEDWIVKNYYEELIN